MNLRTVAPAAIGGLLLVAVTAIYATGLSRDPVYLMHDEVNFALQGHAIADSGRDTNGRFMPLYFAEAGFEAGRDPVPIYAMAVALQVLPLSEGAVRLPICAHRRLECAPHVGARPAHLRE